MSDREYIKDKKRIVIKIGSSSLVHTETGDLNLVRIEKLVRIITDQCNKGKEVVLVSSGAIAVGVKALGLNKRPDHKAGEQACAAVGQARLMMVYQKLFAEYLRTAAQILMTKNTMIDPESRHNARNTFDELLKMGVVPIVNENDTVSTDEIEFGDNDTLSAIVAALTHADLLVLLTDKDGLFTDDPGKNPDAQFIDTVEVIDLALNMVTGFDSTIGGTKTLTVTYEGKTTTFEVFVYAPTLYGDVNFDGKVTSADAAAVLRTIIGLEELPVLNALNADVDGSGEITAEDAATILRYVVKLIDALPAA